MKRTTFFKEELIKEQIDNPYFIYYLGYLWADGNLYRNSITLEIKSSDLNAIKNIFTHIGIFSFRERIRKNSHNPQTVAYISSNKFKDFLIKNDFNNKKEANLEKILSNIKEDLKYYFWRGLSDGDGSFYINEQKRQYNFSFWSSINQDWLSHFKLLMILNIKMKIIKYNRLKNNGKIHKSSKIGTSNKDTIIKFGDHIYKNYKNDNIGLIRKYNKYKEILNLPVRFFNKVPHKYVGITYLNKYSKWLLRLTINGKRKHIGIFQTEEEAFLAKNNILMS